VTINTTPESAPPWKTRNWKFWATNLWVAAATLTFFVVGITFSRVVQVLPDSGRTLKWYPVINAAGWLIPLASGVGVIAFAIRLTGTGVREYLGLIPPHPRDIGLGLVGLVVLFVAYAFGLSFIHHPGPPVALDQYHLVRDQGLLLSWLILSIVVAPLTEEVTFRGFLYRGWAASRMGPVGAVMLTSAAWTALHTQYNWPTLAYIFCGGLLYGAIRAWHGSTTSTMILHFVQNCFGAGLLVIGNAMGLLPDA
jgi:membrane protease YdiL (CAAX protease family)